MLLVLDFTMMDSERFVRNWNRANEAAKTVLEMTGWKVVTVKRQRIYTPSWDPPPKWGCEVFLYNVPRDMFEDELLPVVLLEEGQGRLHQLRLPMDYSGRNRGFAFVTYYTPQEAKSAIRMLDGFEIRPGHYLKADVSIDNRKLYVGGIPKEWTRERVEAEVLRACVGVGGTPLAGIFVPRGEKNNTTSKNRGYAFIEYDDHSAAATARRKFQEERLSLGDLVEVVVDWAQPKWKKVNSADSDKVSTCSR